MKSVRIDTTGMRCPQPVLLLQTQTAGTPPGTIVEIVGDCPTFEKDVRAWCERQRKPILAILGTAPKLLIQLRY